MTVIPKMEKITLIIIYHTLLVSTIGANFNTSELSPGLLFEQIANIEIISGHWKFVTYINLTSFYEEIEYVTEVINKTQEECHTTELLSHHTDRNSFCEGLTAQLVDDLNEIKDANKYFLHNNRQKRGLINIIGSGMKVLFGTMDAYDAEKYEKELAELEINQQKIKTNLFAQNTFIQSAISKLNETNIIVNQHSSILKSLEDEIAVFKKLMIDESFHFQANNLFIQLASYATILTNKIRRDQVKLFDIVFSSKHGVVHDSLINPHEMLEEMKRILANMENQQFPFKPQKENMHNIINTAEFNAAQTNNTIIFEINIPTFKRNEYILYNTVTVPKKMSDQIYSFITPEYTNFAISTSINTYFPMDPSALLRDCKSLSNDKYLCKYMGQIYKTHSRVNCEISIFMQYKHQCPETQRKITGEVWFWLNKQNNYLYILPDNTTIKLGCEKSQTLLLNGIGILSTNGCSVETPKIILPGSRTITTTVGSELHKMNFFHLPFTGTPNQTAAYWASPAYPSIKSIELLNKEDFKLPADIVLNSTTAKHHYIIFAIIIVTIVVAICLLYYFAAWLWIKGARKISTNINIP